MIMGNRCGYCGNEDRLIIGKAWNLYFCRCCYDEHIVGKVDKYARMVIFKPGNSGFAHEGRPKKKKKVHKIQLMNKEVTVRRSYVAISVEEIECGDEL